MRKKEKLLSPTDISSVLASEGIVIMPCDTIYGFVGLAPESEKKIRKLKGRPETKPFLLLIRKEWISRFTNMKINSYLLDLWPGPLTLIVSGLDQNSVAIRVPDDSRLQKILKILDKPLFSTSVNRSGQENLYKSDDIEKEFGDEVDMFVDAGDLQNNLSSTILDIISIPCRILRQGACDVDLRKLI